MSNDTTTLRVEGTDTESLRPADGVLLGAVLASNGSIRDLALVNTGVGPSWRNDYDERGTSAVVAASVEHPTLSSLTALPPALPPASFLRFSPPHGVALLASSPVPTRLLRLAALANCTALSQGLVF